MPRQPYDDRPLESDIQKQILAYLELRGILHWRSNTGAAVFPGKGGKQRFIRFGYPGISDIIAVIPGIGKIVAIEVKRPGEHPTPQQAAFLTQVEEQGGIALVADDVKDVMLLFNPRKLP